HGHATGRKVDRDGELPTPGPGDPSHHSLLARALALHGAVTLEVQLRGGRAVDETQLRLLRQRAQEFSGDGCDRPKLDSDQLPRRRCRRSKVATTSPRNASLSCAPSSVKPPPGSEEVHAPPAQWPSRAGGDGFVPPIPEAGWATLL